MRLLGWEATAITFLLALAAYSLPLFETPENKITVAVNLNLTNSTNAISTNLVSLPASTSEPVCSTGKTARLVIVAFLLIIAVIAAGSSAYKAHLKRVYDPTLVVQFEKEFEEMKGQRGKAAAVLLLYSKLGDWGKTPSADEIEPIFDFFDNLGFYLYGSQVGERVLHQSFFHWICLYYQEGCTYIRLRREGVEGEKSTWEHVEYLVEEVFEIEATKQGCSPQSLKLSPEKYKKYLLEEFEEAEDEFKSDFRKSHPELFKGANTKK